MYTLEILYIVCFFDFLVIFDDVLFYTFLWSGVGRLDLLNLKGDDVRCPGFGVVVQ